MTLRSFTAQRLENPVRRLAKEFDKVLIRAMWRNTYPRITIEANEIADLPGFRTHTAYAVDRPAVEAWLADGGVLYNMHPDVAFIPETDAYVWCEAPFSMEHFRKQTARTKSVCLINRPISWEEHRNTVRDLYPQGSDSVRLYEWLKKQKDAPKPEWQAMAAALGRDEPGVFAVNDRDACDALHMETNNLTAVRKSIKTCISGSSWDYCIPVILRVAPEAVEDRLVYQFIQVNCPKVGKWNVIDPSKMSRVHRNWKYILKQLARHGYLQREWAVYFYYLTGRLPDSEMRQVEHEQALADLLEVEQFVKGLDAYPVT